MSLVAEGYITITLFYTSKSLCFCHEMQSKCLVLFVFIALLTEIVITSRHFTFWQNELDDSKTANENAIGQC